MPTLSGHTRDISNNGLALIVPAIRIGGQYLVGEDRVLQISLELPSGPIQMEAASARYERLEEEGNELSYLIGVHITKMSDPHREALLSFIKKHPRT